MYNDLLLRFDSTRSQIHRDRKSQAPISQVSRAVNQYNSLVVEEVEDLQDHDQNELDISKHSEIIAANTAISATTTSTREDPNVYLEDDGLGKAMEVMTAVQASTQDKKKGGRMADRSSVYMTLIPQLKPTGQLLGTAGFLSSSPHS
jgi:hypothetical protein